ncbi:MFS transporter [Nakamurella endophytica]|uniref:MFS transporter n=1 Tax=Nakamurella endophytica TaxID=1748367 RepID=A0A917WB58_9ACTN|nr:MFS transporter [Nakamurella endophytica]GGL86158.1 MFS transporter [Nakamurella endophytica]
MVGGGGSRTVVLVAMTLANAMVLVDQTAVPLVLPSIIQHFGIGSQQVQWVLNASLLPLAGLLVFGGRLGDLIGRRRTFLLGSLVFAAASACAGSAPTFPLLLVFRVLQGVGGALMLPTTVAIVSDAHPPGDRGRVLGLMGGAAAVAGAFGPVLGGAMTSAFGWRSVLLINVPLAALAVAATLRSVRRDPPAAGSHRIDLAGTVSLSVALIGVVFGVAQSQVWGWGSAVVWSALAVGAVAAAGFVLAERRSRNPLLEFALLRRHRNYRAATVGQLLGGMAEMGLGVLFPLLLVLNLGMSPAVAGLALVPTTLPMIFVAPLAGRWYDRVGGRVPLVTGFGLLAASGVLLAAGVYGNSFLSVLPGLVVYGVGLALVLSLNDPVSLDQVPERSHGQASGVSAAAEQFGGALGIAVIYLVFHSVYVVRLHATITAGPLTDLTDTQYSTLRDDIVAAERTGLRPSSFDPAFVDYLHDVRWSSYTGFSAAFLAVAVLAVAGAFATWRWVRRPALDEG